MSIAVGVRALIAVLACSVVCAGPALADGPGGKNPSFNFAGGDMPADCDTNGLATDCLDASAAVLNQARANMGQSPYQLPADFDSLSPAEQAFVLTNLDRIQYGLAPIGGLTDALDQASAQAVQSDSDPTPPNAGSVGFTGNWGGGFSNMPQAYEAWMFDDGPGSGNEDCPSAGASGCWGHREDVLWRFSGCSLAMGAAAGEDSSGWTGFAMVLVGGDSSYRPNYVYTWSQAVADGAGGADPPAATGCGGGSGQGSGQTTPRAEPAQLTQSSNAASTTVRVRRVSVHHHRVRALLTESSPAPMQCALTRFSGGSWKVDRWRSCSSAMVFRNVRRGRYRLTVRSDSASAVRYLRVH